MLKSLIEICYGHNFMHFLTGLLVEIYINCSEERVVLEIVPFFISIVRTKWTK